MGWGLYREMGLVISRSEVLLDEGALVWDGIGMVINKRCW
jgi:hypothetical protein